MDIRRLEVFVKLMETRSFSQTGQELNLTQPTVSGHVKTLEQQVGIRLFDRHRRQVKPTSAALVLYDYAVKILELRDEAGFALDRHRGRISGNLTLGGSTIPGTYILPGVIGRFHKVYQATRLKLLLGGTRKIIDGVHQGDLEMGVVGAPVEKEDLVFEPLIEDELVLAVPSGEVWEDLASSEIDPLKLSRYPFVIREEGSGTRAVALRALEKKGIKLDDLNIVAELGGNEAVRQAILSGLGASILSRLAVQDDINSGLVRIAELKDLDLKRMFYLVTHKKQTRSPVCNAFIEFLRTETIHSDQQD